MKKIITLSLIGMVAFTACNKKKTTDITPLTTAQKVQNKWNLVMVTDNVYTGTTTTLDYIDTLALGVAGDYIEFKSDNKAYTSFTGGKDTLPYTILSDNQMTLDGDTFAISTLTTSQFVLTFRDRSTNPWYDNVISLKR